MMINMIYKYNFIKVFSAILICFFILSSNSIFAQYDMGMYSLRKVPQTNLMNPAFMPDYKYHAGFPALSSVHSGFGTSGAKYNQFFTKTSDDSLHYDFDNVYENIKDKNIIRASANQQWLNFGMKWQQWYFSASIADVSSIDQYYSKNLIGLVAKGNGAYIGETVNLDPISLKAIHYREYALGAAYNLNEQWNFGVKAKLLFGKSAINTENMDFNVTTTKDYYYLDIETDFRVNTSLPMEKKDTLEDVGFGEYSFSGSNIGMGFDLGATFKLDDQWSFSASVLDLGYVQFDRWLYSYYSNSKIKYEGIGFNQLVGLEGEEKDQKIQDIKDSVVAMFEIEGEVKRFIVPLTAKVYLGANYQITDVDNVGALLRMDIYKGKIIPTFTASYYRKINENIGVTANYSIANRSYFNVGLGFVANYDPVQVYFVTDNLYGVMFPQNIKYTNFRFGINFMIPDNKVTRTMIDL